MGRSKSSILIRMTYEYRHVIINLTKYPVPREKIIRIKVAADIWRKGWGCKLWSGKDIPPLWNRSKNHIWKQIKLRNYPIGQKEITIKDKLPDQLSLDFTLTGSYILNMLYNSNTRRSTVKCLEPVASSSVLRWMKKTYKKISVTPREQK